MRSNGYFLSFIYLDYSRDGNLGVLREDRRDSSPGKNWIKHTVQIAIYWDMQNEGNCVLYLYEYAEEVAEWRNVILSVERPDIPE